MIAPAKINLALHVTGRRPDGYHLIESLVVFAGDGDRVVAARAASDEMVVAGRYAAQVPLDGANLVVRARDLMRAHFGADAVPPLALQLEKALPVASGIGGGSSDAASTMRLIDGLLGLDAGEEALAGLALRLGADVPMCLAAKPLLAGGVGEETARLPRFPALPVVLVNPGVPLATGDVYAGLESTQNPPMPELADDADPAAIVDWMAATRNDLQAPAAALAPEIGEVLDQLSGAGALIARMSGSGASCFGIFETAADAEAAAAAIAGAEPAWFVMATECGGESG